MNTPNSQDPLDETIDQLLASQPLKPSAGFAERVLAAIEEPAISKNTPRTNRVWLRLALPIAALLVAIVTIVQLVSDDPSAEADSPTLSTIELQEIFLFEEGLSGLADFPDEDLDSADLLDTFILLNSETRS